MTDHETDEWDETTKRVDVSPESLRRSTTSHTLIQTMAGGGRRKHLLLSSETIIGRGVMADIIIESPDLSRRHLKVTVTPTEVRCVDLDSANGVFLNGLKIHSAVLRDGDVIQLGRVVFSFKEGSR